MIGIGDVTLCSAATMDATERPAESRCPIVSGTCSSPSASQVQPSHQRHPIQPAQRFFIALLRPAGSSRRSASIHG